MLNDGPAANAEAAASVTRKKRRMGVRHHANRIGIQTPQSRKICNALLKRCDKILTYPLEGEYMMRVSIAACIALSCAAAAPNASDDFYKAIRADDISAVTKYLQSGVDINVKDDRGGTPLMYAAAVGSEGMMRRLIEAGADVNA